MFFTIYKMIKRVDLATSIGLAIRFLSATSICRVESLSRFVLFVPDPPTRPDCCQRMNLSSNRSKSNKSRSPCHSISSPHKEMVQPRPYWMDKDIRPCHKKAILRVLWKEWRCCLSPPWISGISIEKIPYIEDGG